MVTFLSILVVTASACSPDAAAPSSTSSTVTEKPVAAYESTVATVSPAHTATNRPVEATTALSQSSLASINPDSASLGYLLLFRFFDAGLNLKRENMTKDCMAAKGWKYFPVTQDTLPPWAATADLDPTRSPQYVAEHGYGVTAAPATRQESSTLPAQVTYQLGLDKATLAAYLADLYGPNVGSDFNHGCATLAQVSVFGDPSKPQVPYMSVLNDVESQVAADKRVTKAYAAWSGCMAKSGYHFSNHVDAKQSFETRYQAMIKSSATADQQAALQSEEFRVAAADLDCYDVNVRSTVNQVRAEVEASYLERHPAVALAVAEAKRQVAASTASGSH
jgi:hypothetical protein